MAVRDIVQAAAGVGGAGYQISRSLRFNSADSAYLSRTPASAGNRKTWTWSGWVKRSALGTNQLCFATYFANNDTSQFQIAFNTDKLQVAFYSLVPLVSTQVFRDVSAWYHLVVAFDSTQGTASNRLKVYINGLEVTSWATDNRSSISNQDYGINAAQAHFIGYGNFAGSYFNGYLTEVNFIDGQALTPSSFGETNATTGVWSPIRYAGSYGTNGFYLNFSDNSGVTSTTLGKDQAGSNNWTPNNFSVTAGVNNDSLVDTPTPYGDDTGAGGEVRGNYATFNPLDTNTTPSDGNLRVVHGVFNDAPVTMSISSGKWYMEATCINVGSSALCGFTKASNSGKDHTAVDSYRIIYEEDGNIYRTGTGLGDTSGVATYTTNDLIGVAIDMDNGTISFFKNNTLINTSTSASAIGDVEWKFYTSGNGPTWVINMGQRPFEYAAPSGFKALVTTNLPDPTVVQGDDYFNTVLYTGNNTTNAITGLGFSPDLVWIKSRSNADPNLLFDTNRGRGLGLYSNLTNAEAGPSPSDKDLISFDSDGFTLGQIFNFNVNDSGKTFVGWAWRGSDSSAVSNTDGTISSTVSVSTTSGFSIVTWTGTGATGTIGHSLGSVPRMIIVKSRNAVDAWYVYHASLGATARIQLNETSAQTTGSTVWNSTSPTSTVFSIGNGNPNTSTVTYVAYCFAEVEGFSKFGSYTGNGSADGPFVFTGFRPAFVMVKRTDTTGEWAMRDSVRSEYNLVTARLAANLSDAETVSTSNSFDFVSNGFKPRGTGTTTNASGGTYIYMAFASNPFKFALAR